MFVPIHHREHWSLAIICNPEKEDESGEFIILHIDSFQLHDSSSIFSNLRRSLREDKYYLQTSKIPNQRRIIEQILEVPQQKNGYDCGLLVLSNMEHFLREAPERLSKKDFSMFSEQWYPQEEVSNLRLRIRVILLREFEIAKSEEHVTIDGRGGTCRGKDGGRRGRGSGPSRPVVASPNKRR